MPLAPDLLRCPACRAAAVHPDGGGAVVTSVVCAGCGTVFRHRDGVVDLLPGEAERRTLSQLAMEWEPLVRVYESRLWRRSPAMALLLGIGFDRELACITEAAELDGTETVVDLACGPGLYARALARAVPQGTVVGLDLSLPMLRSAVRRARAEGLDELRFVHATALDLPLFDGCADVVNCCGALHLFPDPARALREAQRVLRPGGRFTVAAFRRWEGMLPALADAVRTRVVGLHAFALSELETLVRDAGFGPLRRHHLGATWLVASAVKPGPDAAAVLGPPGAM